MAPKPRLRKLQDAALLKALEDALTAGEPLGLALARLKVRRSTLNREMKRDEAVRRRIEGALRARRAEPKKAPRRRTAKSSTPVASIAAATPAEPRKTTRRVTGRSVPAAKPPAAGAPAEAAALLQALEDALTAGEPLGLALARLSVRRSTLNREMKRDEAVRRRIIEGALRVRRAEPKKAPRRRTAKSSTPVASIVAATPAEPRKTTRRVTGRSVPSAKSPAAGASAGAAAADEAAQLSEAAGPEAAALRRDATDSIAAGTGRLVFGSRRPHPLATVRRMALRSAPPRALERSTPREERLAVHDWLPALLLLIADIVIALAASGNLLVVGFAVLVAAAYVTVMRRLSRAPLAVSASGRAATAIVPAASPLVSPSAGTVRKDLAWVRGTIAEPMPGQRPTRAPRDRPRG